MGTETGTPNQGEYQAEDMLQIDTVGIAAIGDMGTPIPDTPPMILDIPSLVLSRMIVMGVVMQMIIILVLLEGVVMTDETPTRENQHQHRHGVEGRILTPVEDINIMVGMGMIEDRMN